ncbi:hypothetical protein [Arthrobacter sp. Br18]|uniref:hypothetical protein n=1 Tax=Arthrobacter sp. Br18 TaxID=1312954 RepID=UPI00047C9276|nr:hypothetical protein [Arthrobacter sp. Br18]
MTADLDLAATSSDDRYFRHSGRRWRKTDPSIPEPIRARLVSHLGRGRSGVRNSRENDDGGAALGAARAIVQLAKEGLGERGTAWWEQSPPERHERWERALEELDRLHGEGLAGA